MQPPTADPAADPHAPDRPMLVFDGDCGFCTWSATRVAAWSSGRVGTVAWQRADLAGMGLTAEECAAAVRYVDADGRHAGGAAVARALGQCRQPWRAIGAVLARPGLAPLVERGYGLVAANRYRLPGATPACRM